VKSIEDLKDIHSKRVLVRCDLDVPMNEDGTIADDHRVKAAVSTIEFLREKKARIIVVGHMGRPKGERTDSLSLKPVGERLSQLLKTSVAFVDDCIGAQVNDAVEHLSDGEVLLLENVRFHGGEEQNDPLFSKALAELCDVYVNNAFATAHRAHASTAGVASLVKEKAAGFTLRDEIEYFNRSCLSPARPLVAIFGGAKVSTKIKAIKNVGTIADAVIVGGAMANTFLVAQGHSIGRSLYEPDLVETAKDTLAWFTDKGKTLHLPLDVVVAGALRSGVKTSIVPVTEIPQTMLAVDIGPATLRDFKAALERAKTIIWNGPMGAFEIEEFSAGTYGIIDILSESSALTVVGGGDTDLALQHKNAFDKMDFVSTAGGAFLTMLEGKKLPAVEALEE
jgi:phosphoglycerate kinase